MHRCDNLLSPWGGRGVGSERTALPTLTPQTQGHGQLTGLGVAGWVLPPVVRRGEPVCPGREAGRRASAAGPWMAHRRVPWDKRVNRGNPTQEGEQVGVAFLLVTFLWPRKEKSLAKPRSGGETPSRTESSCPARRSRAIEAWGGIRQAMTLPTPHPNPLPQGERGWLLRTITLR